MAFRKFFTPESSNIVAVAYSARIEELHVEFKGGKVYQYKSVPVEVAGAMFTADSVGSFFASEVRPKYETKQIVTPCGVDPNAPIEEVPA